VNCDLIERPTETIAESRGLLIAAFGLVARALLARFHMTGIAWELLEAIRDAKLDHLFFEHGQSLR
jgi:hypothetical protein